MGKRYYLLVDVAHFSGVFACELLECDARECAQFAHSRTAYCGRPSPAQRDSCFAEASPRIDLVHELVMNDDFADACI